MCIRVAIECICCSRTNYCTFHKAAMSIAVFMLWPGNNLQVMGSLWMLLANYTSSTCPALLLFIFIPPCSHRDLPTVPNGDKQIRTSCNMDTSIHTQWKIKLTSWLLIMSPQPMSTFFSCLSYLFVYGYPIYFWEISFPGDLITVGIHVFLFYLTAFNLCHLYKLYFTIIYSPVLLVIPWLTCFPQFLHSSN